MDQFAPRIDTDENTLAKRLLMHWKSELGKTPVTDEPFQHLYCDRMWLPMSTMRCCAYFLRTMSISR